MGLWFSASAVVPQLSDDWHLSDAGATWLTTSVQLGFVAGALASAVLNLPDRMSPVRLIGVAALAGAAANEAVALLAHGLRVRDPAPVPDRRRARRRVSARHQADGDVVSRRPRLRRRRAGRRAGARIGHAAPRERVSGARLAGGAGRGELARGRRRRPGCRRGARGTVRGRGGAVSPGVRAAAVRRPRPAARLLRLLRAHVGALRDVDVGAGLRRRELRRLGRRRPVPDGRRAGRVRGDRRRRPGRAACWAAFSPTRAAGPRSRSARWRSAARAASPQRPSTGSRRRSSWR